MNTDFIGQILPNVDENKRINYTFKPGPFTRILKKAFQDPINQYYLVIEEINRGNALSIFGEVFQLLDRDIKGESSYSISNTNIAFEVYNDLDAKVYIPSNLSVLATINTSDQNVFALDTAFQCRWEMKMIINDVKKAKHAGSLILDTSAIWGDFCRVVNNLILENSIVVSSVDKRLGVYFITEDDLLKDYDNLNNNTNINKQYISSFAEKVLKYLWDDAFKFSRKVLFDSELSSLEDVILKFSILYKNERFSVFNNNVKSLLVENNEDLVS